MACLPASGKSTWIKNLKKTEPSIVVICPDDFRKVITGQNFFRPAEEFVWGTVKTCARTFLQQDESKIVIDATALTIGSRKQWVDIARECGAEIEILWLDVPFSICCERNEDRDRVISGT